MKKTIVGLEPVSYTSKKTGEPVEGVTLYLESDNANVYGQKTSDLYISKVSKTYAQLEAFVKKPLDLIGKICDVDYNEKGFLEQFVLEV